MHELFLTRAVNAGASVDEDAMLAASEAARKAAKRNKGAGLGPSSQAAMFQELESAEQRFSKKMEDSMPGLQPTSALTTACHSFKAVLQHTPLQNQTC